MQSQAVVARAPKKPLPCHHVLRIFAMRLAAACCAIFLLATGVESAPVQAADSSAAVSSAAVRPGVQGGAGRKAVLLLSGAQYGLPVSDALTTSAVDTLREKGLSFSHVYVEMLDLVRNNTPQWRAMLAELLRHKISQANIGLVITQNQAALEFIAQEGNSLMPADVPVLATLVSNPAIAWHGPARSVLSIISRWDIPGTIRYGMELFPRTKRLVLIGGAGST